jgi:hypothetical protein
MADSVTFHEKLAKNAKIHTSAANATIETCGVRQRACTAPKTAGKSPRSASANIERGTVSIMALM